MQNYTDGNTSTYGLIGNPVKHTMSPLIHNSLARMTGTNLVYVPFEVAEGKIGDAIKGAEALNIQGLNVTVPYKSDVIPFLEEIDPLAEGIGAVNTLVRTSTGGFKGYNTDMSGLLRAMRDEGIELEGETVVILGAGGVARPVAYLCTQAHARKVYVLNRTYEKALDVVEEVRNAASADGDTDKPSEIFDMETELEAMALSDYKELLEKEDKFFAIQCTSVGLFPDVNSAVIEDKAFYSHLSAGLDLVYRPLETKFLELAKEAGAKTFSGLKMLLYQGIEAFELWNEDGEGNGIKITKDQIDEVYESLVREVNDAGNIILEGFMGSGKTTVSRMLSDMLMMELMDTDKAIEDMAEISINDIFERYGEEEFRECETNLISYLVEDNTRGMVLSLGGGLPMREVNRHLLKELGKVVYLRTKPETVYERVKDDTTRPLLAGDDPMGKIKELLSKRGSIYEEAADLIVDTDGKDPEDIAIEIIKGLGLEFKE
ncbi:shikimate kinase [Butyrivibrio proteoclasticus]|uniref:shikimate kinase n=1 Tax=Butyrivibrio proteoclasticus TaxID=43305 RepID=UPI0004791588|nr:shikimate kinase [Butyrivibrio proteoclasticus]